MSFNHGVETKGLEFSRETARIFREIHKKDLLEKTDHLYVEAKQLQGKLSGHEGNRKVGGVVQYIYGRSNGSLGLNLRWRMNIQKLKRKAAASMDPTDPRA